MFPMIGKEGKYAIFIFLKQTIGCIAFMAEKCGELWLSASGVLVALAEAATIFMLLFYYF